MRKISCWGKIHAAAAAAVAGGWIHGWTEWIQRPGLWDFVVNYLEE